MQKGIWAALLNAMGGLPPTPMGGPGLSSPNGGRRRHMANVRAQRKAAARKAHRAKG